GMACAPHSLPHWFVALPAAGLNVRPCLPAVSAASSGSFPLRLDERDLPGLRVAREDRHGVSPRAGDVEVGAIGTDRDVGGSFQALDAARTVHLRIHEFELAGAQSGRGCLAGLEPSPVAAVRMPDDAPAAELRPHSQ